MKIVFVSNYYNHHQKSLCEALYAKLGDAFTFISTGKMREERKKLGYGMEETPSFVEYTYTSPEQKEHCCQLIDAADVVIAGSAPEEYLQNRRKHGKLIFRYSERLYKQGFSWYKWPIRALRFHKQYSAGEGQYLLCASAYTAADFAITGNFRNKAYQWGYFPETISYDPNTLMGNKKPYKLLWCGRMIDWKHPDDVIYLAKRLKDAGYDFEIDCIGTGDMEDQLTEMILKNGLENKVRLLGAMSPAQVRKHMETAGIYLFTSDFQEGWGAVLNEAMNSGCAVVASHAAGSVPFLIEDGENGRIYKSGDLNDLYHKVCTLLETPQEQIRLGKAAYHTITSKWNASVAADRFLQLVAEIQDHGICDTYADGPCSKAKILKNDWFGG